MNMPTLADTDLNLAMDLFEGAIGRELNLSSDDLSVALGVANMKLHSGDSHIALQLYVALVLCSPQTFDFQCGLSNCALQMQEYSLALQAASAMIALDPQNARGYYFSSASCLGLELYTEAREDIDDAIRFAELNGDSELLAQAAIFKSQIELVVC